MTLSRSCNVFLVGDITFLKTNKGRHSDNDFLRNIIFKRSVLL